MGLGRRDGELAAVNARIGETFYQTAIAMGLTHSPGHGLMPPKSQMEDAYGGMGPNAILHVVLEVKFIISSA